MRARQTQRGNPYEAAQQGLVRAGIEAFIAAVGEGEWRLKKNGRQKDDIASVLFRRRWP